ncbi:MAG: hypothetical protein ACKVUT_05810 [Gaiella sp.]
MTALGLFAVCCLVAGLAARHAWPLGLALPALAAAYAAVLLVDELPLDRRAPLVAALVLITGETAFRALEVLTTSPDEPGGTARELARTAGAALVALAVGLVLIAAADGLRWHGTAIELAAAAAAVAAFAALLAVRRASPPD